MKNSVVPMKPPYRLTCLLILTVVLPPSVSTCAFANLSSNTVIQGEKAPCDVIFAYKPPDNGGPNGPTHGSGTR